MSESYLVSLADPSVIERLTGSRPVPRTPNAKDFVRAYAEAIKTARENGWTVEQIHAELQLACIQIEIHTLRKYVSDLCGPVRKRRKHQDTDGSENGSIAPASAAEPSGLPMRARSLRRSLAGKA